MRRLNIKANHKIVRQYYEILNGFTLLHTFHETAVKAAFQRVLEDCAKQFQWTLIQEYPIKRATLKGNIRVDGAVKNDSNLVHGHWEAKDENDDLDKEIKKKFSVGYPKDNIIFQSPSRAVLYQNGKCLFDEKLDNPQTLVDLLKLFFEYTPPYYEQWEIASSEFKNRIPEIGNALIEIIEHERKINNNFIIAFKKFSDVIKTAINPNLSDKAIEDMLIQHILTERIFRKVFNNPDFTNRNIIAHEIEKVISSLTSRGWNRDEFLKQLDRFYLAIEETAKTIDDFSELQGFLNTLYENFFRGFSVEVADTHGIVYTPQPAVNFMVRSIQQILEKEFDKKLSDKNVHIIDPFVGTGNFILSIMNNIDRSSLIYKYSNELHCNEIMLLPYYIASMNIEHQYFELTGEYKAFDGICLVDTFELNEEKEASLFSEENTERVIKQKDTSIFVIAGNPPYNSGQQDENDNNKNRKYDNTDYSIDSRIAATYGTDSRATLKSDLGDVYVKAIRWASDRINKTGEGVIGFITNNSFLDDKAFDGMRKHLLEDFSKIYILDLKGNIRRDSMRDGIPLGEKHTVFGMSAMVGICISFFVKNKKDKKSKLFYDSVPFRSTRSEKFEYLESIQNFYNINWQDKEVKPDAKFNWLTEGMHAEYENFLSLGDKSVKSGKVKNKEVIFTKFSLGISTNRSEQVYDFNKISLENKIKNLISAYNSEVSKYQEGSSSKKAIDTFVSYEKIKWSSTLKGQLQRGVKVSFVDEKIRYCLYRPFTQKYLYFDPILNDRPALFPNIFPDDTADNIIISIVTNPQIPFVAIAAKHLVDLAFPGRDCQNFPFYYYENGTKVENISDDVLTLFREKYQIKKITKKDIFNYVYAVLHSPSYRKKYAENLKREIPKIPFLDNFNGYSVAGAELIKLHASYENTNEYKLKKIENKDEKINLRVEKMKFSKDKHSIVYNDFLTLTGIPSEAFEYKLGNRSALDWIIDQYQVEYDENGKMINDPNKLDDPEYIIKLIAKITTVSAKTIEITNSLPKFKIL